MSEESMVEELRQWRLAHQRLFDEMTVAMKERDALQAKLDVARKYYKHIKYMHEQMYSSNELYRMTIDVCDEALKRLEG